ncbi:hypothetical protein GCK32_008426, partial [Trichostrongylus colubriformis]
KVHSSDNRLWTKWRKGIVEAVALSTQRGRFDLGHNRTKTMGIGRDLMETWNESKEDKTIEEHVRWMATCPESTRDWVLDYLEGSEWIEIGEKRLSIDDETNFCDGEILRKMLQSKNVFDVVPHRVLREARARADPYETIGAAFFRNRTAMKVANLDRTFGFIFSGETEEKLLCCVVPTVICVAIRVLAERQSTYLQKYLSFAKNSWLIDKDQGLLREDCLKHWLVPNKTLDRRERGAERRTIDPDQYFGRFARTFYGREDFNARLPRFDATLLSERTVKELRYAEFSLNILSNRASTQPELLISTGIVPKVRLGWGNHERYVVPPQLIVAGVYSFDQLAQVRRKFSRVRHSGEEVLIHDENGHLIMCKAIRVARLLKEAWKMGWSCRRSMKYAFCPQRPEHSYFEPQWEEAVKSSLSFPGTSVARRSGKAQCRQKRRQDMFLCSVYWSWENSLLDNYGPRVILENDSHKSGPTVNSVLREVAETDKQCGKSVTA